MAEMLCAVCRITPDEALDAVTPKFVGRHRSRNPDLSTPACRAALDAQNRWQNARKAERRKSKPRVTEPRPSPRKGCGFARPEQIDEFVLGFTVGKGGLIGVDTLTHAEVMAARRETRPARAAQNGLYRTARTGL